MPLSTFHSFPNLPIELRQRIWHLSLPPPAIVEIEFCANAERWFCPSPSLSPSSGLLGANFESREIYLEEYIPMFLAEEIRAHTLEREGCNHGFQSPKIDKTQAETEKKMERNDERRVVYVDLRIDTLYIGPNSQPDQSFTDLSLNILCKIPTLRESLKYLAVEKHEWSSGIIASELVSKLEKFPRLKSMTVVVWDFTWLSEQYMHRKYFSTYVAFHLVRDNEPYGFLKDAVREAKNRWKRCLRMGEVKPSFKFRAKKGLRGGPRRIGGMIVVDHKK